MCNWVVGRAHWSGTGAAGRGMRSEPCRPGRCVSTHHRRTTRTRGNGPAAGVTPGHRPGMDRQRALHAADCRLSARPSTSPAAPYRRRYTGLTLFIVDVRLKCLNHIEAHVTEIEKKNHQTVNKNVVQSSPMLLLSYRNKFHYSWRWTITDWDCRDKLYPGTWTQQSGNLENSKKKPGTTLYVRTWKPCVWAAKKHSSQLPTGKNDVDVCIRRGIKANYKVWSKVNPISALTLSAGRQEEHPACTNGALACWIWLELCTSYALFTVADFICNKFFVGAVLFRCDFVADKKSSRQVWTAHWSSGYDHLLPLSRAASKSRMVDVPVPAYPGIAWNSNILYLYLPGIIPETGRSNECVCVRRDSGLGPGGGPQFSPTPPPVLPPIQVLMSSMQVVLELLLNCTFWRSTVDIFHGPVSPSRNFRPEPPVARVFVVCFNRDCSSRGELFVTDAAGCRLDARDQYGRTALYFAAKHGHPDVVRLLVSAGADLNIADTKGWTPLTGTYRRTGVGHGSTQPKILDPTQTTEAYTRPNPTHRLRAARYVCN